MFEDARRRFVRWQVGKPAKLLFTGTDRESSCYIKDISLKGMQLLIDEKLDSDSALNLEVELQPDLVISVEAWVSWEKGIDNYNVYGVYFTRISDKDKEKIYHYLYQSIPDKISGRWWDGVEAPKEEKIGFDDRRVFSRFPVKLPLYFLDREEDLEGEGQTFDFSVKGVGFVTEDPLKPNTTLEMWIRVPDRKEPLYTRGEVVWSNPIGVGKYRAGVNLEKADLLHLKQIISL